MDPVDRTFNALYYWSQRAKHAAEYAAGTVASTTAGIAYSIATTVASIAPGSENPSSYTPSPSSTSGWSLYSHGIHGDSSPRYTIATTATVLSLIGLAGYAMASKLTQGKTRRRAQRLPNGARKEVVLIVGSVSEPLTRYIANDLESRGFIVYITSTNTKADQKFFLNESFQDIKSLIVSHDPKDTDFNIQQIHKFDYLLSSDHIPFQGAEPNKLNLVGIIFAPDMYFPAGKFHMVPSTTWNKSINDRALMPLNLLMSGVVGIAEKYDSNIIFLTPTISTSLTLPYHSLENITIRFLQELSANLANDYQDLNITNLKLGAVNINSNNTRRNFGIKGNSIKKLHYKIFDLLYADDNNAVDYVGVGARALSLFGWWVPRWLLQAYFRSYFTE